MAELAKRPAIPARPADLRLPGRRRMRLRSREGPPPKPSAGLSGERSQTVESELRSSLVQYPDIVRSERSSIGCAAQVADPRDGGQGWTLVVGRAFRGRPHSTSSGRAIRQAQDRPNANGMGCGGGLVAATCGSTRASDGLRPGSPRTGGTDCLRGLVAAGFVVRHGPVGTPARLTTNGVGGASWLRGRPLTEFRRRRRILPLPLERVKIGAACI